MLLYRHVNSIDMSIVLFVIIRKMTGYTLYPNILFTQIE